MTVGDKDRLGRGLGALLGSYMDEPVPENELRSVPVARLVPNPFQPRRDFAEEELHDLRESIKQNGLLQPLVVRRAPGIEPRYQLVAGERRLRAVAGLGWEDVSVVVRDVDDETLLVLALVENLQREALNALEEAEGYQVLSERFGLTQEQIASAVGRSRSAVANMLRLLHLPPSIRKLLASGSIATGHARAFLSLDDPIKASDLARRAARDGWSVREVERRVRKEARAGLEPPTKAARPSPKERDAGLREIEQALQDSLGTRVQIRSGQDGGGSLKVTYHSSDDLERLVVLMTGREASEILG